jgi:hypothetical protein
VLEERREETGDGGSGGGGAEGDEKKASFIDIIGRRVSERKVDEATGGADEGEAKSWFPGWAPKGRVPGGNAETARRAEEELARVNREKVAEATAAAERERKARERVRKAALKEGGKAAGGNPLARFFGGAAPAGKGKGEERVREEQRGWLLPWQRVPKVDVDLNVGAEAAAEAERGGKGKKKREKEDVWRRIFDVIVPNRGEKAPGPGSTEKEAEEEAEKEAEKEAEMVLGQADGGGDAAKDVTSRRTGVESLYRPPAEGSDDGNEQRGGGESARGGGMFGGLLAKTPWGRRTEKAGEGRLQKTASHEAEPGDGVAEEAEVAAEGKPASVEVGLEAAEEDVGGGAEGGAGERERSPAASSTARAKEAATVGGSSTISDISSVPQTDIAKIRNIFGSETFFATETLSPPGGLIFRGNLRGEPVAVLAKLEERLHARLGDKYTLCLAEGEEDLRPVVVVCPTARDMRPASSRQQVFSWAIGGCTLATCYFRALYATWQMAEFRAFFGRTPEKALAASGGGVFRAGLTHLLLLYPVASISVAIVCVVSLAQAVQRWMARRHDTRINLPYFLPSYQLGSFGSIVQVASPTPTRAALFDIALAGAATMFLSSLLLLLVGLRMSTPAGALMIPVPMSVVSGSMIVGWLTRTIAGGGQLAVHNASALVGLHPVAVVGANCLTIAALNLLPIRQLDGGRIVSAIYGRKTAIMASRVTIFFLLLASSRSNYFFIFVALVTFGPWSLDRPAKNELTEPNNARALVGYVFLLLMLCVLLPFPANIPLKL